MSVQGVVLVDQVSVEPSAFRAVLRRLKSHHIGIVRSAKHNFGARGFADSIYLRDPDAVDVEVRSYPTRRGRRRTRG